jgi:MFS family permease
MISEARAGLSYVLQNRYLRSIAACTGTSNLFSNMLYSVFILYMVRDLLLAPEQIGLIFSIGSIGFLVGALTANRIAKRIGIGPTIVISIITGFPAGILIAISPPNQAAIPLLIAAGLLGGFSQMVYNINQVSFRQAITPPRMQGRMNASMRFIVWGTIPPGQILGGIIAGAFGISTAIWIGALGEILPILIILLSPVRSLREMPEAVDDDVTEGEGGGSAATPDPAILAEALDETPEPVGSAAPVPRAEDS